MRQPRRRGNKGEKEAALNSPPLRDIQVAASEANTPEGRSPFFSLSPAPPGDPPKFSKKKA